ncbi:PH domain-containing protein [Patescibacteria group bacterium]
MFKSVKLKDGEKILLVVRQTPIAFGMSILIGLILFLLPFFLLFPLFSWGKWGMALFFVLLFGAILFALYQFINWYFNCGIITNQRVIDIDQTGLTDRVVSEVPYYKIDDVSYNIKGVRQSLFRYGNVVIAIRGYRSSVTLRNIHRPWLVQELILEVERQVRGWNKEERQAQEEERQPMDKIMGEVPKLSDVERRALKVALKKMKKS